jgi:hypothetical protein
MYFILDQADDDGADHFYVYSSPSIPPVWTTDLLLAYMFNRAEDAARVFRELDDPGLIVAALPEDSSSFCLERENYRWRVQLQRARSERLSWLRKIDALEKASMGSST